MFEHMHAYQQNPCMALLLKATVFLAVAFAIASATVTLKVGIYNSIPDLNKDNLSSYKTMIEDGFNALSESEQVIAVVDSSLYDPYGNLTRYILEDDFDLLEIDAMSLKGLVEDDLVVPIPNAIEGVLPAAAAASLVDGKYYLYPTLVCGNFIISLYPGEEIGCSIEHDNYEDFHKTLETCHGHFVSDAPNYKRLVGGKMNDNDGYYVPIFYIDGYIDIHGRNSAQQAIDTVLAGTFDEELCNRLTWFTGMCNDKTSLNGVKNKCYYDFDGSYVQSSSNIYPDIANNFTMFYFGFSEKLGEINQLTTRGAEVALSGPFGHENNLLMFTDGLVISKKSWDSAENKKTAIRNFVSYFAKEELRENITLGRDLEPNQKRYLLQANTAVYSCSELIRDKIYRDLFKSVSTAVPLPYISGADRKQMQAKLTKHCMKLHPRFLPAKKRTLAKGQHKYKTGTPSDTSCK